MTILARQQTSVQVKLDTMRQIATLADRLKKSKAWVVREAIERMYNDEMLQTGTSTDCRTEDSKMRPLGNPQLGPADPKNPNPPVVDPRTSQIIGYMQICTSCGGYFWAECPCWGTLRQGTKR